MEEEQIKKLRDKLSLEKYGKPYDDICWRRQYVIDDMVRLEQNNGKL